MIEFNVSVNHKDIRNYMFTHKYKSVTGVIELVLGAGCLIGGAVNVNSIEENYRAYMLFLIFFGVFFLIISPIQTLRKAASQFLTNPVYKQPMKYVLSEEGIDISQGEDKASLPWGEIYKVSANKRSMFIYISKYSANILPKACFEDKVSEVEEFFKTHLSDKQCKLK